MSKPLQWHAKKPLEIVASDMTKIRQGNIMYKWIYILDTFNNEIISHHISTKDRDKKPYYKCLEDLKINEKVSLYIQLSFFIRM
ncbi:hypothetical protein [Clostridium puniceum]|uniref:hypothetical protein n=1 Tax=Clostridium puniceum TaxID=29367 RepID=UPI00098CB23A|nr:hypothetical protein [Clostridium puniceum]